MRYHYLRLLLSESTERHYSGENPWIDDAAPTRDRYLLTTFRNRIDFTARTKSLVYVPIGEEQFLDRTIVLGRIGRKVTTIGAATPEWDFMEVKRKGWAAANIAIDITEHSDGQKVAFQEHWAVGRPLFIMRELARHLNKSRDHPGWIVSAYCVKGKEDLWQFVGRSEERITSAEFDFVVPNLFGSEDDLSKDLNEGKDRFNANKISTTLTNTEGALYLNPEHLNDAVNYTAKGGGAIKLKSGRRMIYNSEAKVRTVSIPDDKPLSKENRSFWYRLINRLF